MRVYTCDLCKYSTDISFVWSLHLLLRRHRCRALHYAASGVSSWGTKGKSLILVAVSSYKFSSFLGLECLRNLKNNSLGLKLLGHFVKKKGVVIEDIVWSSRDPCTAYLRFAEEKQIEKIMEKRNRRMMFVGRGLHDIVCLHRTALYTDSQWNLKMEGLLPSVVNVKDILHLK